jgi:transposase
VPIKPSVLSANYIK